MLTEEQQELVDLLLVVEERVVVPLTDEMAY